MMRDHKESQGEWSQNFEWMQEMATPNFRPHYSISEMLQRPNLLSSFLVHFLLLLLEFILM